MYDAHRDVVYTDSLEQARFEFNPNNLTVIL